MNSGFDGYLEPHSELFWQGGKAQYRTAGGFARLLTPIVVSSKAYHGYYQTIDYAIWERGSTSPTLLPITEMRVKAQIARPGFAEAVSAGQPYRVHGAAWTSSGSEIVHE